MNRGYTDITIGMQLILHPKSWHLRFSGRFGCYHLELGFISFTFTKQFFGAAMTAVSIEPTPIDTIEQVSGHINNLEENMKDLEQGIAYWKKKAEDILSKQ